jgi:hypothetical protein
MIEIEDQIYRDQVAKRAVRLTQVQKDSKKLDQTKIVTPGTYDNKTGLFIGSDAAGNQYRFKPLKSTAIPENISLILASSSQVASGDFL